MEKLSKSKVKNVNFVGRRGPLQIACTIKELREMINLPEVKTIFNEEDFAGIDKIIPGKLNLFYKYSNVKNSNDVFSFQELGRPRKRLTELLYKSAMETKNVEAQKFFNVLFKRTPLEFKGDGKVGKIRMAVNVLEGKEIESQKAIITTEEKEISCGLALRSIGKLILSLNLKF